MSERLFNSAGIYRKVFGDGSTELPFFRAVCEVTVGKWVLDLGAGSSPLAGNLAPGRGVGVDLLAGMLCETRGMVFGVCGDAARLPFGRGLFQVVVSRLHAVAYACGQVEGARAADVAGELARVTAPGGRVALEIPLAWRPAALQGVEEQLESADREFLYHWRYLDVLAQTPYGEVLDTLIEVHAAGERWCESGPLHVYTPHGARKWLAEVGFDAVRFYAPYDLLSGTDLPPGDCLSGVVVATLRGVSPDRGILSTL